MRCEKYGLYLNAGQRQCPAVHCSALQLSVVKRLHEASFWFLRLYDDDVGPLWGSLPQSHVATMTSLSQEIYYEIDCGRSVGKISSPVVRGFK